MSSFCRGVECSSRILALSLKARPLDGRLSHEIANVENPRGDQVGHVLSGNSALLIPGETTISIPTMCGQCVVLLGQTQVTAVCGDGNGNMNVTANGTEKMSEAVV